MRRKINKPSTVETTTATEQSLDNPKKSQVSNGESNSVECNWLPGDMLWGRVGRQPFWPCLVVVDPQSSKYMETKRIGRPFQQIHVQYYGDNGSHSWVSTNQILKYTGKNDLLKFAETKKKDKRYSSAFPQPGKNQKWDCAVLEAEEAASKPSNERILFFEEIYPIHTKDIIVTSKERERVNKSSTQKSRTDAIRKEKNEESSDVDCKKLVPKQDIPHETKKRNLQEDSIEVNKSSTQKSRTDATTKEKIEESSDVDCKKLVPRRNIPREAKKRNLQKDSIEENSEKKEGKLPTRKIKRRKAAKKPPGVFEVFVDRCADMFAVDRPEFQNDRPKLIRFMRAMWSTMSEEEKSRYHGSYEDLEALKERVNASIA